MISQSTGRIAGYLRSARSILIAAVICYGAWPYYSAEMLRQALQRGDVNYVHQKIDWRSLKISVKGSISALLSGRTDHAPAVLGANLTPNMIDNVVDRVLTPPGLIEAYQKLSQSSNLNGKSILKYVRWAFFSSPTRFEVEIEPGQPTDPYAVVVFELVNFDWVVTKFFIRSKDDIESETPARISKASREATEAHQRPNTQKSNRVLVFGDNASSSTSQSGRVLRILKTTKSDWQNIGVTKKLLDSNFGVQIYFTPLKRHVQFLIIDPNRWITSLHVDGNLDGFLNSKADVQFTRNNLQPCNQFYYSETSFSLCNQYCSRELFRVKYVGNETHVTRRIPIYELSGGRRVQFKFETYNSDTRRKHISEWVILGD